MNRVLPAIAPLMRRQPIVAAAGFAVAAIDSLLISRKEAIAQRSEAEPAGRVRP